MAYGLKASSCQPLKEKRLVSSLFENIVLRSLKDIMYKIHNTTYIGQPLVQAESK